MATSLRLTATLITAALALFACGDDGDSDSSGDTSNGTTSASNTSTSNSTTSASNTTTSNSTSSTSNATTGAPGVSMCGGFVPRNDLEDAEACAACVDTSCCAEATACGDDADCLAFRECFAGCPDFDGECLDACNDSGSEETLDINRPYITCRNESCGDACQLLQDWSCVGQAPEPSSTAGTITLTVGLLSFQGADPVEGATVKFCAFTDLDCAEPLATETTNADGNVTAAVEIGEKGFEGYLEVTGGERFPTLLYFSETPTEDIETSFSVLGEATANGFAAILGLTFDEERAHAASIAFDCQLRRARGVRLSAASGDDQTVSGYIAGGLPSPEATATDNSGVGGVFNIPPGTSSIIAERAEDNVQVFEREVILRAGFITSFNALPTAR